jgi:hypothetical protein
VIKVMKLNVKQGRQGGGRSCCSREPKAVRIILIGL